MTTIIREVKVNASQGKVWEILADIGGIQNYNPGVSKSYSTSESNSGLGASRHCDLLPMGAVEERVIEWNEGSDYKIEIFEGKGVPPFKTAVARITVKSAGNGAVVTMHFEYRMKYGLVGALMDAIMVKPQFSKAIPGILAGLKHHAETGELIDRTVRLNFEPVIAVA